jgi:hypothetical protein
MDHELFIGCVFAGLYLAGLYAFAYFLYDLTK